MKGNVVPQRRRTAVPTAMIAALISLSACELDVSPSAIPVPFSVAPAPSASVGQPAYVCTAVYKILTDGALKLAGNGEQELRETFAAMSADVREAAATSIDAAQKEKIEAIAASLDRGAAAEDPKAYLAGDFESIGQELDGTCT
ncbi:hypothetical protein ACTI_75520 [Actinoplanes sp. OR16]|uniref:hypothetical protein n=1 Tax=Actinoplanes sp. OR16 TaxID=946334 RepID=UPI000F710B13|nr:hypothetical protein [Actinoplanes sp. OR16]BBH70867.1 hypothetical protein ACTI_75520 [Actinoplanes sp. OR16]